MAYSGSRPSSGGGRKKRTERQGFGGSKGCFTTKILVIANTSGLPMKAEISSGEVSDYRGLNLQRIDPLNAPKVFIADKGYDSNYIRDAIATDGGTSIIPARPNGKAPEPVDRMMHALRNHVERCFNKTKCSRRLATRYDKSAASYLGFVQIVAARLWVKILPLWRRLQIGYAIRNRLRKRHSASPR